ncbi:MAG: EAL domain-containing protein, partial [Nitrosomonas sp.]|nr:EAL domain-containing protein [Nitrosomonas sp.]
YGFFWAAGLIAFAYLLRQTKARESDQIQAEERVLQMALFDELTGLPNRRLMRDRLEQTKLISTRSDKYCALLFIDLDNFKLLNDTFGHEMGDILLRDVACRLNACVRADDTVARMGGDEFVVLLKELSLNKENAAIQAEAIGAKVLMALNESFHLNNVTYNITPSIGATLFEGQHTSYSKLLKQADLAMYKAKRTGRNKLCFYDPEMENVIQKRAALEKDLHEAVKKKQFVLHYQIQVDDENHPKGAEILVRWQHPEYGLMLPAEFIALAEETEQIVVLGYWILEAACIQLAKWALKEEMSSLTISVNVSVKQFKQHDFVDRVLAIIKQTGANPLQLKMELTESLLISNKEETIEKMVLLKAAGIGFSLDDFGTGFSSLSYLKRLPLDWLKIDRSFVQDILTHENDAAIIKTIISLAQNLGLEVIAEGVETTMQKEFLIKAGCFDYQGYLFGRPLSLEHFEECIAQLELVD